MNTDAVSLVLNDIRIDAGLSQTELARRCGVGLCGETLIGFAERVDRVQRIEDGTAMRRIA